MTEQTIETIDTTIAHLEGQIRAAESRFEMEAHRYATKRDRMVRVAHEKGTANSIGSALDDLLEEFGLPRRPWRGALQFLIEISQPVAEFRQAPPTAASGSSVYWVRGTRITRPMAVSMSAFLYPDSGHQCLCGGVEDHAQQWVREYLGRTDAEGTTFRVANPWCQRDDCVNRDRPRNERPSYMAGDQVAAFDFGSARSIRTVVPTT